MSVKDIAKLGKLLAQFLAGFAHCFARPAGRALLHVYVRGLLSDVQRKNAEAIALDQNVAAALVYLFALAEVKKSELNLLRSQGFPGGYPGDPRAISPPASSMLGVLGDIENSE